jgi:hypothetical protein
MKQGSMRKPKSKLVFVPLNSRQRHGGAVVPAGLHDNSPAFQRRVRGLNIGKSRRGRLTRPKFHRAGPQTQPSLRDSMSVARGPGIEMPGYSQLFRWNIGSTVFYQKMRCTPFQPSAFSLQPFTL